MVLKALSRFWIDPERSRNFDVSGDDSRDTEGEGLGVFRVRELARSAMEGDLEAARTLPLRTEKNAGEAPVGAVVPGEVPGALADSFSRALMRWEIPDPRLTFFARGFADSELIRFK